MRVSLNGLVVSTDDQWLYDWFKIGAFSPGTVRKALAENPEGEDLELEINSPGGSVYAGFEMYAVLQEAKCNTVAIVQSLAASAASTVMAACREVRMSPVAQVMIHLPSTYAHGNQNDLRHEAKWLEQITQSILNGYEEKCGGKISRDRLDKLIRAESWLTAQEAVEIGLADSILGHGAEDSPLPDNIINAAGAGIRALTNASGPVWGTETLMSRYEQMVRDGAEPAEGHPVPGVGEAPQGNGPIVEDWRAQARLEVEKLRF